MKRAAIYARYSSDKQNERSIDDQVALCRVIAERAGYAVVSVYHDSAISGASTINRPGFLALLSAATERAFDVVVVEDLDRAFRDEADYHLARKRLTFLDIAIHAASGLVTRVEGSVRALLNALALETLAVHTHRGMSAAAAAGRNAGGRAYGYRPVPGAAGNLTIDNAEADIVRRIYAEYVDGRSARTIAVALNTEGIPAPRGRHWNASTIGGSRARLTGILQNPLYDGRLIWNRQHFIKNPDTAKRVTRINTKADWITVDLPALRIVDAEVFRVAQARRAERGGEQVRRQRNEPRHLLSSLIKCACCGGSYAISGSTKYGPRLACSRARESGTCKNTRTVGLAAIESRVIKAIADELAHPSLVAVYVREFHKALASARNGAAGRKRTLERRLSEVKRESKRIAVLMIAGAPQVTLKERLTELEATRAGLEHDLSVTAAPAIELHPGAADAYRRKIATLGNALAKESPDRRAEAYGIMRELVDKIVLDPATPNSPITLEIHGRLAALFPALERPVNGHTSKSVGVVVAGARVTHPHTLPPLIVKVRYR